MPLYYLLVGRRMESVLGGPWASARFWPLNLWMFMLVRYHYAILPLNNKTDHIYEKYIFYKKKVDIFTILSRIWSRIRIRSRIRFFTKRIRGSGSISKWNGSKTLLITFHTYLLSYIWSKCRGRFFHCQTIFKTMIVGLMHPGLWSPLHRVAFRVLTDIRPQDSAFSSFNGYQLSVFFLRISVF